MKKKLLILFYLNMIFLCCINAQDFEHDIASNAKTLVSVGIGNYIIMRDTIESSEIEDTKYAHVVSLISILSYSDLELLKLDVDAFIKATCNIYSEDSFCINPWYIFNSNYVMTTWILHGHLVDIICGNKQIIFINYHK